GADDEIRVDAVLHARVARLTDANDQSAADPDVCLQDPEQRVHHDHGGNDEVEDAVRVAVTGDLTHTVADDFAAPVDGFLAGEHEALLDLGDQGRVGEPEAVARGRAVQRRVRLPRDRAHRSRPPSTSLSKPNIRRLLPPSSTRSTSRSSPASKRI